MKRNQIAFLPLCVALLASCGLASLTPTSPLETVERDVYRTSFGKVESLGKASFLVHHAMPEMLYCDINQYASLIAKGYKAGFTNSIVFSSGDPLWSVNNAGGKTIFTFGVEQQSKRFFTAGSLSSAMVTPPTNYGSLSMGATGETNVIATKGNIATTRYDFITSPIYTHNGSMCLPLGIWDAAVFDYAGFGHFNNTKALYQFASSSDLELTVEGDKKIVDEVVTYHSAHGYPQYLANLERDCFLYTMENNYGLASVRGIRSMVDYYKNTEIYDALASTDDAKRSYAYGQALGHLNDDHTGWRNAASWWGEDRSYFTRGPLSKDRAELRKTLTSLRDDAYGEVGKKATEDVLYSASGETALFSFDGFTYCASDPTDPEKLSAEDSLYYFVRQYDEIVTHKDVKRIVIDDSINGGGVVGVMGKLLAFLSKDKKARFAYYMEAQGTLLETIYTSTVKLDYEKPDYELYVLTSPYSFSCGNAFPTTAKRCGIANLMGARTGGGECTIQNMVLPSGKVMAHSTKLHIGFYHEDKKAFEGYEFAPEPDIPLTYDHFYDLDYIEAKAQAYEQPKIA